MALEFDGGDQDGVPSDCDFTGYNNLHYFFCPGESDFLSQGVKLPFFSGGHLAPKYFKVYQVQFYALCQHHQNTLLSCCDT